MKRKRLVVILGGGGGKIGVFGFVIYSFVYF